MRHKTKWAALALGLAVGLGCGGGGGGGGGSPTNPVPPGINFNAASSPTEGSCFLRQGTGTNASRLFLDVRVNDVTDWYGVAFDLRFPGNLLSFARAKEGGFLSGATSLQVVEVAAGHLVVGHTKLGDAKGRRGSGLLMTLEFTPVGAGSGSFTFENEQAFGTNSFPMSADFIAGSVSVSP